MKVQNHDLEKNERAHTRVHRQAKTNMLPTFLSWGHPGETDSELGRGVPNDAVL